MTENNIEKGLVMEANPGEVIVMTHDGEFKSLVWGKEPLPEVGSEIIMADALADISTVASEKVLSGKSQSEAASERRRVFFGKFLGLAASLLLCLFSIPLLSSVLFPARQQVIAYVSIDINPSVELGLDEEGIVREAFGLNEDGTELLSTLHVVNQPVDETIRLITEEAAKKHYIAPDKDNNILVTFSTREGKQKVAVLGTGRGTETEKEKVTGKETENDPVNSLTNRSGPAPETGPQGSVGKPESKDASVNTASKASRKKVPYKKILVKLEKVLNEEVKTALHKQNIEAEVELLEVPAEIQREAKKQGLSAGKYAIMLEAKEAGLEINVEDMKFSSVVQAIKEAGGIPGQIISRAKQDQKRLSEIEKELRKLGKMSDDRVEKGNSAKDLEKQEYDRKDYGRDREQDHGHQDIDKNNDKKNEKMNDKNLREKYSEKFKEKFNEIFKEKVKENSNKNNKDKYNKDNEKRDVEDKEDKDKVGKDNRDKEKIDKDKQKDEKRDNKE
jgi:hypothetical protein